MSAVTAQLVFAFVSHSKTQFSLDEGHMISRNFTTYPEHQQKQITRIIKDAFLANVWEYEGHPSDKTTT